MLVGRVGVVMTGIDDRVGFSIDTPPHRRTIERRFDDARKVFEQVALDENFVDFLTLPAYELID